jgi:hypothetical protein
VETGAEFMLTEYGLVYFLHYLTTLILLKFRLINSLSATVKLLVLIYNARISIELSYNSIKFNLTIFSSISGPLAKTTGFYTARNTL